MVTRAVFKLHGGVREVTRSRDRRGSPRMYTHTFGMTSMTYYVPSTLGGMSFQSTRRFWTTHPRVPRTQAGEHLLKLIDTLYVVNNPSQTRHVFLTSPLLLSHLYSRVPLLHFRYGAYLLKEQVVKLVGPHPENRRRTRVRPTNSLARRTSSTGMPKTTDTIIHTVGYALPAVPRTHTFELSRR